MKIFNLGRLTWWGLSYLFSEEVILLQKVRNKKAQSVILYGASNLASRLVCLLTQQGIKVAKIVDKRALDNSLSIQGYQVCGSLNKADKAVLVVICVLNAEKQVVDFLCEDYQCVSAKLLS